MLSRLEVDDERWNNAVSTSSQTTIYALSWYLDVVCDDWCAIVWPSKFEYQVILPLPTKNKWGVSVIQQPMFCQYLGFFYQKEISAKLLSSFLAVIDLEFSYISSYSFSPFNYQIIKNILPAFVNLESRKRATSWLNMNRSYQEIHACYSRDRKLNLKRARQGNWLVEQSNDIAPLLDSFRENHERKIEGGVNLSAYSMFTWLFERISLNENAEVWYAVRDNEIQAGILIVRCVDFGVYLFNASDEEGRKGNARSLLLDTYFQRNAGQNFIFDFESPEVESVASFYRSFGGEERAFISIRKNELPFPFKQVQNWRKKLLGLFAKRP